MSGKAILAVLVFSVGLQAGSVSLSNDFSLGNGNPNGQWQYLDGSTLLSLETPVNNGNLFYNAVSSGYWGFGNDLNVNTPDLGKAQVSGSLAGETDADFLAGDIVAHSPNDGSTLFETWTAPSDGTISSLIFNIWYAHSAVQRSNDFSLLFDSTVLDSGTVSWTSHPDRNNPESYSNAGFAVTAGETISLGIAKSSGQSFGSIDGENLSFTFTSTSATPEPASFLLAFPVIGVLLLRRYLANRGLA